MSNFPRKLIFDAVRVLRGGQPFTLADVKILDAAIDAALGVATSPPPALPTGRRVSAKGIALIHSFESCKLDAYPDPGSRDGHPWTIGWGSTGEGISKGLTWTQAQCDARFEKDINEFAAQVNRLLGDAPTTQHQFDALVSLAYNIGIGSPVKSKKGGLTRSTVLRLHKAGDYKGAARSFIMWNKNDGQVMRGLTRRRLAESDLYDD